MSRVEVAVIVVSWNTAQLLGACLRAFDEQDHPDTTILVIDNASSDGSRELLDAAAARSRRHPLRVVHQPTNRGFAGAVNDALALTEAPVVVISNVDVEPEPDLVSTALATLLDDQRRGTVQPKLLRTVRGPDGQDVIDTTGHELTSARLVRNRGEGEFDRGQYDAAGPVFGASGALVMHRREMLDEVAWQAPHGRREVMTEDLFAFFEDVELDWRARLFGWDAWYEPSAVARHQRGGAGPRRTPRVEALNWANRLLVITTCDDWSAGLRAGPLIAVTTLLKTVELFASVPRAGLPALRRLLRGLPGARRRRRELLARARLAPQDVVARWVQPFGFRPWVRTWWRRVTGRAPGVAK